MLKLIKSIIDKLLILLGLKAKEVVADVAAKIAPVEAKVDVVVAEVKKEV